MTLKEFTQDWMLLTAQPWGKAYRVEPTTSTGEPSPGEIQSEFYFQTVRAYHGEAWKKACLEHAKGERWPSLDALTTTMDCCLAPMLKLAAPTPEGISMDEALQERPDLLNTVKRVLA